MSVEVFINDGREIIGVASLFDVVKFFCENK